MTYRTVRHGTGSEGYLDVRCDSCKSELEPVFESHLDENGAWESLQANHALSVRVDGGYGMFIDPIEAWSGADPFAPPLDFLLCQRCVIKLMDENPWLAPTLTRYIDSHIGHTCDDEQFVWVPYNNCMRSKNHGVDRLEKGHSEDWE